MVTDIVWIVVKTAGSLFGSICAFRAYLKFINLHPNSSLFQVVKNCTNWISEPLSKIFPPSKKYDWGSISGAVLISFFVAIVFYFSKKLQVLEYQEVSGISEFVQPFGYIMMLGLVWLVDWCLHLIIILIIGHVLLSWVSPVTKIGAMRPIVEKLVSPLLMPLQKIIFKRGSKFYELNFDPSPILLLVLLQILFLVNDRMTIEIINAIV